MAHGSRISRTNFLVALAELLPLARAVVNSLQGETADDSCTNDDRLRSFAWCGFWSGLGPEIGTQDRTRQRWHRRDTLSLKGRSCRREAESLNSAGCQPNDLEARFMLIGYYTTSREPDFKRKRAAQAFWLIENIPDSSQLEHLIGVTLSQFDEGFDKARKLWLKQLELHPVNTGVLSNAAHFFLLTDKALAEKLLKAGAKAEPNEPRWHNRLGHLHMLQVNGANFARIHPGCRAHPFQRSTPST